MYLRVSLRMPKLVPLCGQKCWMQKIFSTMVITPQRNVRVYSLKNRTETAEHGDYCLAWTDRDARHKSKIFHTDKAAQFVALCNLLKRIFNGVTNAWVYSPQSNSPADRRNRSLLDRTRPKLNETDVEKQI